MNMNGSGGNMGLSGLNGLIESQCDGHLADLHILIHYVRWSVKVRFC